MPYTYTRRNMEVVHMVHEQRLPPDTSRPLGSMRLYYVTVRQDYRNDNFLLELILLILICHWRHFIHYYNYGPPLVILTYCLVLCS